MRRGSLRRAFGLGAVIGVLLAAGAGLAAAFEPVPSVASYEIPLPASPPAALRAAHASVAAEAACATAARSYGGTWRLYGWNALDDSPRHLYGGGSDVAPSLTTDAAALEAAQRVIATQPTLFRVNADELRHAATTRGLGKVTVHFQQTYAGLDVWGARARATFTESGRLFVLGSTCFAGIDLDPRPALSREQAQAIARAALPFDPRRDAVAPGGELLVLPFADGRGGVAHALVWRVRVTTQDPLGEWVTHVDAHSGEILWRYNDVHFIDYEGTAHSDVQFATWCNGEATDSAPHLRIEIDGVGQTTSDANGDWTIPYGGSSSNLVHADLYGPYIDMNNVAGAEAYFATTAAPGAPLDVHFDDGNAQQDERDVFDAINDIHDFFELFAPGFGYTNQRISAYVSRSDGYCPGNAWWNGTINFCAAGGSYANTGEIQGVAHHEYGHGVQDHILGWQGDEGLGEGNSDILANMMTDESIIGRGFYIDNCTSGIRDSDNSLIYPDDLTGSVHHDGQIVSGFHWDTMRGLQALYGDELGEIEAASLWHYGRVLQHPTIQPDQVLSYFIADDDDGNLDNGTPHYSQLCAAAENHGFECPEILLGVIIDHTPVATREEEGDVEVTATVWSTEGALNATSPVLYWRHVGDPGFTEVPMTPTGGADEYTATIPNLTQPAEIEYYLYGEDVIGNSQAEPRDAPAELHGFAIASVYDPQEQPNAWSVNLEGDDDAETGIWERVDPIGTSAQPENDHTVDPGRMCWITGQGEPGGGAGDNDIDGGTTTLYSAVYDLTDATAASVRFWRWYSNDKGADPNNDIWTVQVRNNGGAWQTIESNQNDQNSWVERNDDLYARFGTEIGEVQLKFIASDLNSGSLVEAGVDDFVLLVELGFSSTPEETATELRYALHGSRSNPVTGPTEIRFEVPAPAAVELTVFDVTGRALRRLADERFDAGAHAIAWDGRDNRGQALGAGIYYVRMRTPDFDATRTLVLSR